MTGRYTFDEGMALARALDQQNQGLPVDHIDVEAPLLEMDHIDRIVMRNPTQDNCSIVFAKHYGGKMLYAHKIGAWFEWDGAVWARENTRRVLDICRHISRKVNHDGKANFASHNFILGSEMLCRVDREFAITGEEFDRDNYLLNTPAGIVDLRTGKLSNHDPGFMLSKITAVAPSNEGGEVFMRFLDEITGGDKELQEFHQVSLGACLSGAVESHWMLFWTGEGRNGKNTLGDAVQYVMGTYAIKIVSSALMQKKHESHPTEIAQLNGARLAVSSEVSEGDYWHESRINELTGDATISARFMRGDFFEFQRTHKHLIYGNHRPQLRSVTNAIRSRIKIVPFKESFIGREDAELPEKLKAEAGFILSWLIEGHGKWLNNRKKLPDCAAIHRESDDYFSCQSTVEAWIKERVAYEDDQESPSHLQPRASDLYSDYFNWKEARGEAPISQTRWGEIMTKHFVKVHSNGARYRGAKLLPAGMANDE